MHDLLLWAGRVHDDLLLAERPTLAALAAARDLTPAAKPVGFWATYEPFLAPRRDHALTVLELGVWRGDSLCILADYFPRGRILGVDLDPPPALDLRPYGGRATVHQANQADGPRLDALLTAEAPRGVDVVIDDASHLGRLSLASWRILWPRLRPGGLYIVEDWTTAYVPTWPDAGPLGADPGGEGPIQSHTAGMAGFVKALVDLFGAPYANGWATPPPAAMHVYHHTAILRR